MNEHEWDHAGGVTYEPNRPDDPGSDHDRLKRQYLATVAFMSDHEWHQPSEIVDYVQQATGAECDWAAVSARVRDIRKPTNGGWGKDTVSRRYLSDGLWEYRLNEPNDTVSTEEPPMSDPAAPQGTTDPPPKKQWKCSVCSGHHLGTPKMEMGGMAKGTCPLCATFGVWTTK